MAIPGGGGELCLVSVCPIAEIYKKPHPYFTIKQKVLDNAPVCAHCVGATRSAAHSKGWAWAWECPGPRARWRPWGHPPISEPHHSEPWSSGFQVLVHSHILRQELGGDLGVMAERRWALWGQCQSPVC